MSLIQFKNVSKTYNSRGVPVKALSDINLDIEKGDFVCVAGPSGSGKSTLLHLMGGIDVPTKGDVYINGISIAGLSRTEAAAMRLKNIGFVFQAFNLIPVLSAYENIEYVLQLQGVPDPVRREKVEAAIESVGLKKQMRQRPGELSGGQQQRLAVARAIVGSPPVVVADEPTGNLDTGSGEQLLEVFELMNSQKNITFVFSSHDPRIINRAGRIITLIDGKIS